MKSLSKSSQIPLYQQVVEWIRENIYTGDLVEDDRIPSEYQIMDMLEVSREPLKKLSLTGKTRRVDSGPGREHLSKRERGISVR